jgi:hypothetical protein
MAWYKCKVIFAEKTNEDGERREDVKEQYAVEAVSVTDAATIIQGHLEGFDFSLEEVTKMQINPKLKSLLRKQGRLGSKTQRRPRVPCLGS